MLKPIQAHRGFPRGLAERSLSVLSLEFGQHPVTAALETVEVARAIDFAPIESWMTKEAPFSPPAEAEPSLPN